jgi:cytochrome c5
MQKRGFKVSESGKIQSGVRGTVVMALAMVTLLVSGFSMAAREDDIRERLQPAGTVCVMGDSCAAGIAVAGGGDSGPKDPQQVYQTYCFACHGTGANNSPVLGNAEHWNPRIEKGIDARTKSPSPPTPLACGSTTASVVDTPTAASNAFPPACRTSIPAWVAKGCWETTAPRRPITSERQAGSSLSDPTMAGY